MTTPHANTTITDATGLLEGLTEPQAQAVTHQDGPLLIVAGAGSGKTRVITRRVAYLVSQGVLPHQILAITFTNKAAKEMKNRVGQALGHPLRDWGRLDQSWPTICTFHSLCLRILRHYHQLVGLDENFTIYDSADQTKLMKEVLKLLDISATRFSPGALHSAISNAKNKLITPEQFAAAAGDFFSKICARVYIKYQQLLSANKALDFDDLILKTVYAFRDHGQILSELQERFQYILIDEYQDTNHAQYMLVHALAQKHRNICVVGDPDQSIYAWRGADLRNILDFEKDYPDATVVKLERNYRSTQTILAIADNLISHNQQRKEKKLWTENDAGEKATIALCRDERDEAQWVTQQLKALNTHGHAWSDMAVFYRINALSRVMEDALRRSNVPYQIARGVEFYNRREIKDVMAYLRVIANPADEVSLVRIINTPTRGIGDSSIKLMQQRALDSGRSLWQVLHEAHQVEGLSTRAVKSIQLFVERVEEWQKAGGVVLSGQLPLMGLETLKPAGQVSVRGLMERVVKESGLEAIYTKEDKQREEGEQTIDNINELVSSAAEFDSESEEGTLAEYLATISLVSDADHMRGAGGAVTLMTLHAAKGLEFPVVAMIGLEEGILPHARARDSILELEEERRLCFVGITRTQEKLLLSKAGFRTIRGLRERTVASPFLSELPRQALEIIDRSDSLGDDTSEYAQPHADDSESVGNSQFRTGQMVRHPTFGVGRISEISQSSSGTRAVVDFTRIGRKTLILQFARLTPVQG